MIGVEGGGGGGRSVTSGVVHPVSERSATSVQMADEAAVEEGAVDTRVTAAEHTLFARLPGGSSGSV